MNLRPTRQLAVGVGIAFAITVATPTLASASTAHGVGADNLRGGPVAVRPFQPSVPAAKQSFPSASSTVIGSIGFIDGTQVGYFWSAARGDSIEQTFSGPAKVKKAVFKPSVPYNGLAGSDLDWTASINGTDVGSFTIAQGETGPVTEKFTFAAITGGSYDVKIRVTNEVPSGDGAIILTYAGTDPHSLCLQK